MNDFMDQLDQDLNDCFFNLEEFGEEITYRPASGNPESTIQGLFDAEFSMASTEATEDVSDHRPHLTLREVDLETGEILSGDRFVARGQEYRPAEDNSNTQGVIRVFLHEV